MFGRFSITTLSGKNDPNIPKGNLLDKLIIELSLTVDTHQVKPVIEFYGDRTQ